MPEEIGRCHAFTPGWLENESIWLHMEYKYLLELLKQGLCDEFYDDFYSALIPFQDPQQYGRNILENSSFIASSAFPYAQVHGNGFVARLSGSTVEFLHMWLIMNLGPKGFSLNSNHEVILPLAPMLSRDLFDTKTNTYTFTLFSHIPVTYHNPTRQNTYGKTRLTVQKIVCTDIYGESVTLEGNTIPAPYALQVRNGTITRINAYVG